MDHEPLEAQGFLDEAARQAQLRKLGFSEKYFRWQEEHSHRVGPLATQQFGSNAVLDDNLVERPHQPD